MSSNIYARLGVTDPDTPIRAYLGGSQRRIPIIEFGSEYEAGEFSINLNTALLTREQRAAWLRRLAEAAATLADQVEQVTT